MNFKKIFTLLLASAMLLSAVACAKDDGNNSEDTNDTSANVETNAGETEKETESATESETSAPSADVSYTSSIDLAEKIYAGIPDGDTKFPGGGAEITLGTDEAAGTLLDLGLPAEFHDKLESAAQYRHMMNANTFSAGVYQFKTEDDAKNAIESLRKTIQAKEWMCGFPEKVAIITLPGNYVISMYGMGGLDPDPNFAVDFITPFIDSAKTVAGEVTVAVDEPVM